VGFKTRVPSASLRRADLEIGDTAGWETCATKMPPRTSGFTAAATHWEIESVFMVLVSFLVG